MLNLCSQDDVQKLLVVDDDLVVRSMLQRLLEEQNYQVVTAENGEQAVLEVAKHLPDLVLMDAAMPVMDGFQACQFLREHPESAEIPVIMLTSLNDEESVDKAFDSGAVEYITKPINWAVLRNRISLLINTKRALSALSNSEARFRCLYEQATIGIAITSTQGQIQDANPTLQNLLDQDDEQLCERFINELFLPADSPIEAEFQKQLYNGERNDYQMDKYFFRKDGQRGWARLTTSLVFDDEGDPVSSIYLIEDITRQTQNRTRQRIAAKVFETTTEPVMITDANGVIMDVNQAFTQLTGYHYEELLDQHPTLFDSGRQDEMFFSQMWNTLRDTGGWQGQISNRYKDGGIYQQMLSISGVRDEQNEISAYVAFYSDCRAETQASPRAETPKTDHSLDMLTGLPGRQRFQGQLTRACRNGSSLALFIIDFDNFRAINKNFGYEMGDQCLQELAKRLRLCAPDEHMLARLEEDSFALLLYPLEQRYDINLMAERIIANLIPVMQIGIHDIQIDCNIGIGFHPGGLKEKTSECMEALQQHADLAMHLSRQSGKNTYQIFSEIEF
ncbi:PAS domain S-box protein [Candidatus Venteria ishoeyi]|uniref:Sensor histidine kinase TmoS n=1 Tax=Candidatus Venteria ishoeyi TaxID=1899563 RepID=A0A1H6F3V3_9GAMM|nr:PAS domain S-box protein [Candidatus Venteria ishoeyi]MDM8545791.1 PAS domain S-box protein [Candidatus Venteria ishoeyi]SEH04858.1 Sensor histidine kinase TmoS [Candidatus Venteria ishoeyi]